ncbi:hydroxysqualene dehydroxylase [Lacunimicrobium album]
MTTIAHDVIIVGGGLAGLACAVGLAEQGIKAVVLESRPRLGGRATSINDPTTGEEIDNCQHVAMGCCVNFLDFCRRVGIDDCFVREPSLTFVDQAGNHSKISANPLLPAPLNLAGAFGRAKFLSYKDKLVLARGLMSLYHADVNRYQSFAEFLERHHQTPGTIRGYWEPVLVSALSESMERIDFRAGRKVFVDGFLSHVDAWPIWLAKKPLGWIYGERIVGWLKAKGVDVRMSSGVEQVDVVDNHVKQVRLRGGDLFSAKQVVVAVPWFNIHRVLSEEVLSTIVPNVHQFEAAPISSVHLWYDRPITPLRHAVLLERASQWLFNRTAILEDESPRRFAYQVVISQSRELLSRPQSEIAGLVDRELREAFRVDESTTLLHSRVITEHKAVFSPMASTERFRPTQKTSIEGLYLAGDWTQTGWPATMEGAVISGYKAAEELLSAQGRRELIVQPEFKTRWWTRAMLAGGRVLGR